MQEEVIADCPPCLPERNLRDAGRALHCRSIAVHQYHESVYVPAFGASPLVDEAEAS